MVGRRCETLEDGSTSEAHPRGRASFSARRATSFPLFRRCFRVYKVTIGCCGSAWLAKRATPFPLFRRWHRFLEHHWHTRARSQSLIIAIACSFQPHPPLPSLLSPSSINSSRRVLTIQQALRRILGAVEFLLLLLLCFQGVVCRFALLESGDICLGERDLGGRSGEHGVYKFR
jgi:hypothetical protein